MEQHLVTSGSGHQEAGHDASTFVDGPRSEVREREPHTWTLSLTTRVLIVVMALAVMGYLAAAQPTGPVVLGIFGCFSFAVVSLLLIERIKQDREQICWLEERLTVDPLTRVLSRTGVLQFAEREIRRALRSGKPLGLLFVDLDRFKAVNDTYGHGAGDEVLRVTAQRLIDSIRAYDAVGRYGGDEFVVVLPECGRTSLRDVAERLRVAAEQKIVVGRHKIQLSLSIGGISTCPRDRSLRSLLDEADRALYRAKEGGRNRASLVSDREGA